VQLRVLVQRNIDGKCIAELERSVDDPVKGRRGLKIGLGPLDLLPELDKEPVKPARMNPRAPIQGPRDRLFSISPRDDRVFMSTGSKKRKKNTTGDSGGYFVSGCIDWEIVRKARENETAAQCTPATVSLKSEC
jgi:hypothetical protein